MLPESKIRAKVRHNNRTNDLFTTNMRSSDPYRPRALSDYEKKKNAQKEKVHEEIQRVSLEERNI